MENGRVVMSTLRRLKKPATAMDLARQIDLITKVGVRMLMPTLKATLQAGIKHGFIQRKYGKYFLESTTLCSRPRTQKAKKAAAKRLANRKKKCRTSPKRRRQKLRKMKRTCMPHQRMGLGKSAGKKPRLCMAKPDRRAVQAIMAAVGRKLMRARVTPVRKIKRPLKRKGNNRRKRTLCAKRPIYKYKAATRRNTKNRRPIKNQRTVLGNRVKRIVTTRKVVRIPRGVRVVRF